MNEPIHDFTFEAKTDRGPVVMRGGTQVGAFVVAPSFADAGNEEEHAVAHWPTGYALCRCENFGIAMKVADDASCYASISQVALMTDSPHADASLETDDVRDADRLIGDVIRWVQAISSPVHERGRVVTYMVSDETFKSYRDWRTG